MVLRILMVVDTDGLSMKFDFQFSMVLMVLIVVMVLIVNLICPFAGSRYTAQGVIKYIYTGIVHIQN